MNFTENGIRLPFGKEGLWYDMSGKGQYKFYVPDIETQQVAFIGTVRYGGQTTTDGTLAAFALRLKIVDNKITEVEQLDIRPDNTSAGRLAAPVRTTPPGGNGGAPAAAPARRFPPTGEAVEKLGKPNPVFFETIPAEQAPDARGADQDRELLFRRPAAQRRQGLLPVHRRLRALSRTACSDHRASARSSSRPD